MKRAITARRHANPQQQSPFGRFSVTLLAFITDGIGGMVGNNSKNRRRVVYSNPPIARCLGQVLSYTRTPGGVNRLYSMPSSGFFANLLPLPFRFGHGQYA